MARNIGRKIPVAIDEDVTEVGVPTERVSARLTGEAARRLAAECRRRYFSEAAFVPFGKVISEALMAYLPEVPAKDVEKIDAAMRARRGGRLRAAS